MRTPDQYAADYTWLTPEEFALRAGLMTDAGQPSVELVRRMIREGTSAALRPPLIKDVSRSTRPRYRIHPDALSIWEAESVRRAEEALATT